MNISSKNMTRTIAVGVVAFSISSLGSWVLAAGSPAPSACTNAYMQAATVTGQNLSTLLESCYVNRPATADTSSCVQGAFKAYYQTLLAAVTTYQSCAAAPSN
jgi:hypothetical protein